MSGLRNYCKWHTPDQPLDLIDAPCSQQSLDPTSKPPPKESVPLPLLLSDTITYEIRGIFLDGDNALRYKIKHEDQDDEEELEQEEVLTMVEYSLLLVT